MLLLLITQLVLSGIAAAAVSQGGEYSLYPRIFSNGAAIDRTSGEYSASFAIAQQNPTGEPAEDEYSAALGFYSGLGSGAPPQILNLGSAIAGALGPEVSGFKLGVPRLSTVSLQFDEDMLSESFASAIKLTAIRDRNGRQIISELPAGYSYDPQNRTLEIWPISGSWSGNTFHELTISTSVIDYQGLSLAQALEFRFVTMLEAGQDNTVVSPDGAARIILPAGALQKDAYLVFNSSPSESPRRVDPGKLQAATAKLQSSRGKFYLPYAFNEINAYDAQNSLLSGNFAKPGRLTLFYPDADSDGLVDSAATPIKQKNSSLYWLDEPSAMWVKLPDSGVNAVDRQVTASVPHFTVFAAVGSAEFSAQDAFAYPVPFRPHGPNAGTGAGQTGAESSGITFMNLPSEAEISVFNARGELVWKGRDSDGDGKHVWNVKNDDGFAAASGVYFYVVRSARDSKTGKLVIIR
ncbi:MAG: T9SS type A sorting domain-containing protein [Elusimicrobia bacterium]|nr:T9SS type A sorting domain-containing protein [Elusimicrobiota bacterium]